MSLRDALAYAITTELHMPPIVWLSVVGTRTGCAALWAAADDPLAEVCSAANCAHRLVLAGEWWRD